MRMLTFAKRNAKEILRDPLTVIFSLGFPIVLLFLLSAIQANIPVPLFEITNLTPGITVFGLAFMTLFSANLIAKDRESAFLQRLYTSPLTGSDFIFGYALPIIPIAVCQAAATYAVAMILGMKFSFDMILAIIFIVPVSLFFIASGLFFGSIFNVKQVGGICGALFTNLTAWLSGVWFDVTLVGGAFEKIANALPFIHAVELLRGVVVGNYENAAEHLAVVILYSVGMFFLAVLVFRKKMKNC